MATLWFGGSFNPIHNGHLICARAVAESAGFEKVVLVPSAQPPHKPGATDLASPQDRATMCRIATAGDPLFAVDDLELTRTGPSYTIDSVAELKRRGETEVNWLIGADMLAILPQWHSPEELVRQANLILMARPGWSFDWDRLPQPFRHLEKNVVEAPLIDISATDIRRRIQEGRSIHYLVPEAVEQFIHEQNLYKCVQPPMGHR